MKNIWHYATHENSNVFGDDFGDFDGYDEGAVYVASYDGGLNRSAVCVSDDNGAHWNAILWVDHQAVESVSLNKRSGSILFAPVPTSESEPGIGLGVKLKAEDTPFYVTQEKDGIAGDVISDILINEDHVNTNSIGEAYLLHGNCEGAETKISKYDVYNNSWSVITNKEWDSLEGHNKIRKFNGITYVLSDGMLSYSKDDLHWNFVTSLNVNQGVVVTFSPEQHPLNFIDIHISSKGHMYLLCYYNNNNDRSYVLKSVDEGKTWDILFFSGLDHFRAIEAKGSCLYFYSSGGLRVYDESDLSVRLFNGQNGLTGENVLNPDDFLVTNSHVYLPTEVGIAIAKVSDVSHYMPLYRYVTTSDNLASNHVFSIASKANDTLVFVGTDNGLSASNDGGMTWSTINQLLSFDVSGQKINDISYTTETYLNGDIVDIFCLATESEGLVVFSPSDDSFSSTYNASFVASFGVKDGLVSDQVTCLLSVPSDGAPMHYCGHFGEGLSVPTKEGKWRAVTKQDGLAGDYILSIRQIKYHNQDVLFVCGYDVDPLTKKQRIALSISSDAGNTWTSINELGILNCKVLYDICYDEGSDTFFGVFSDGVGHALILLISNDGGHTWTFSDFFLQDRDMKGCNPKLYCRDRKLYMITDNLFSILDLSSETQIISYQQDGLCPGNSGSICFGNDGQIYIGNRDVGLAITNLACIPFYDYPR